MKNYLLVVVCFFLHSCEEILPNAPCEGQSWADSIIVGRKVLVIGIDGFRSDAMKKETSPFLYDLSLKPTTFFNDTHLVEPITISGPNWTSIFTGVHGEKHNVINNGFKLNNLSNYPHFFHYLKVDNPNFKTASIANWEPINKYIAFSYSNYAPIEDLADVPDLKIHNLAKEFLVNKKPFEPDVLFVYYHDLDTRGHQFGFHSDVEGYRKTLATIDNYVNELFSVIESKRVEGEDWLVIVVSDHGGDGTSHNDPLNEKISKTLFFINHPFVEFRKNCATSQVDLAPTILNFLGVFNDEFYYKTDGITLIK